MEWHALNKKEVLDELKTTENGLSEKNALLRLQKYGENKLKETHKIKPFVIFLKQFHSFLIYILLAVSIISAFLKNWVDFGVILGIVFLNSTLGFVQEYRAEKAIKKLKEFLVPKVKVLREGKLKEINSIHLVPGDILVLNEGDKVMADARLVSVSDLQANESVLTGESMPQNKSIEPIDIETSLIERKNIVFMGTTIARGHGKAVVVSTGMASEFGKIARLVQKVERTETPLQKKLNIFSRQLGIGILFLCAFITIAGVLAGLGKLQMFLTGVSLAVAAIPEGLPAVITICLALTVQRMFKVNALIRKLPAAETLGRTTVICTDKTGTLTAEEMTVRKVYCSNKIMDVFERDGKNIFDHKNKRLSIKEEKSLELLLKIGCLSSNARMEVDGDGFDYSIGDPTEKAIVSLAHKAGLIKKELTENELRIKEYSFTSARKIMSIVREKNKQKASYVKGAPVIVLERCSHEFVNGSVVALSADRREELKAIYIEMASRALRVLAFAFKPLSRDINQNAAENKLIFVGFQGMLDPPRKEVKEALWHCMNAGIKVIMITGDSEITAKAVAEEIGLHGGILRGDEIDKLGEEELEEKLNSTAVFARVTPQHKLMIIDKLKNKGEIVAVTGDGVNDVLALKKADIGISMGIRGTDVARDVSDMVLLDDNFATITKAIHEGRRSYDNTKKFIKYMLTVNLSEIGIILFGILAKLPLPLLPLQILWINLITDSFPALALSLEKAEHDVMQRKPNKDDNILKGLWFLVVIGAIFASLSFAALFLISLKLNYPIEKTRTLLLTTIVMFEMFFVFACRSRKSIIKIGFFSNKWLIAAVAFTVLLQVIVIYTPLSAAFKLVPLTARDWLTVMAFGSLGFIAYEIKKLIFNKEEKQLSSSVTPK